jgi:thioredoxin-like negative regulator of GroEL
MKEWIQDDLNAFLGKSGTGLVYFYTPLCGTCQVAGKMLGVVEQIVDVEVGKMNLNFYPGLAVEYAVESVPCLLFIRAGKLVETIYAFRSVPYLLEKVKENLG